MSGGRTTGEKLKDAMERAGVSQHQLARLANVAQSNVSKYLHGKQEPNDATLKRLADALHLPVEKLKGTTKKDVRLSTKLSEAIVRIIGLDCVEVQLDKNKNYMLVLNVPKDKPMYDFIGKVARAKRFYKTQAIDEDMYLDLISGLVYKYECKGV
jgi:transcriptional regulator with XRE-family HTH domain